VKRIFVDMDGVLADFVKGVTGPKYLNGPLVDENTYDDRKIELSNRGLFLDLPKMPDMDLLINHIKTMGVYWEILTCSGTLNRKKVMQDKIAWIKKHIHPMPVVTGTLKGKHKGIYAAPGHVLIDDRQDNIHAWVMNGGQGILHKNAECTIKRLKLLQVAQKTA
jgi:5'(3')-deoxyribonucleotidase